MDTSTANVPDGSPPSTQPPPESSPTPLPISGQSNQPSLQKAKLELADFGRLMQDNHRVLQMTADSNKALRQQALQSRQAQLNQALKELGASAGQPAASEDDMGDILIDSPTTVQNYHPATKTSVPGSGLLKGALLSAALLAGGAAGTAALLPKLTGTPPVNTVTPGKDKAYIGIYEQWDAKLKAWKELKREPLK